MHSDSGRNILVGPERSRLIYRCQSFAIAEKRRVEFRAEAFNALNTPQFKIRTRVSGSRVAKIDAGSPTVSSGLHADPVGAEDYF